MTPRNKIRVLFELNPDQYEMLEEIARKYDLPDASKALRCLLDHAATDGDWEDIFRRRRCRRCG